MQNLSIATDTLSEALRGLRFQTSIFCRSELGAPWGFAVDSREFASFHLVTHGSACVDLESSGERVWLTEGDLVILPHGDAHVMRDAPGSTATRLETLIAESRPDGLGGLVSGGAGPTTTLLCGGFRAEGSHANRVIAALPRVLHLQQAEYARDAWLSVMIGLLSQETTSARAGTNAVLTRLADTLFVEAIRSHLAPRADAHGSFLAGMTDPRIGAVLSAVHENPAAAWTFEELGRLAAMSRTALACRFREIVGVPPFTYIAHYRMRIAAEMLRSTHLTLPHIADRAGYRSDSAFSRAFRRWSGQSPAGFRSAHASPERGAGGQLNGRRHQLNARP